MFKDKIVRRKESPAVSTMTSPVFFALQELLTIKGRARVLNLGSFQEGTHSMFSDLNCDIDSCNLFVRLKNEAAQKHESESAFINRLRRICGEIMPSQQERGYDIVLCWDGFNYLPLPVYKFLNSYLVNFINPETMLHMYFHLHSIMPANPGQYETVPDGIQVSYPNSLMINSPAYTQGDLSKFMPRYTVVRSMLLQSGLQEYLMKVEPL